MQAFGIYYPSACFARDLRNNCSTENDISKKATPHPVREREGPHLLHTDPHHIDGMHIHCKRRGYYIMIGEEQFCNHIDGDRSTNRLSGVEPSSSIAAVAPSYTPIARETITLDSLKYVIFNFCCFLPSFTSIRCIKGNGKF